MSAYSSPFQSSLLSGKTALVTGAGKGIGRQCALSLVQAGAKVIAVARTESDLLALQSEAGNKLSSVVADASSDKFLHDITQFTDIDILVNNLGTNSPQALTEVTDEALDNMLALNVRTVFRITRQIVQNMLARELKGSIVNVSSQMGHVGSPKRSVYCATKHAIEGFTKATAVELGPMGIRVNSVCPTFIETPLTKPMLTDENFKRFVLDKIPLGRIGQVTDVANAVVFLASDAASMITGSSIMVDGGWTAH